MSTTPLHFCGRREAPELQHRRAGRPAEERVLFSPPHRLGQQPLESGLKQMTSRLGDGNVNKESIMKVVDRRIVNLTERFMQEASVRLERVYPESTFYGLCLHLSAMLERSDQPQRISNDQIMGVVKNNQDEYALCIKFARQIEKEFDVALPIDEGVFITMSLSTRNMYSRLPNQLVVLVAMHGDSTASSIAGVVNSIMCCNSLDKLYQSGAELYMNSYLQLSQESIRQRNRRVIVTLCQSGRGGALQMKNYLERHLSLEGVDVTSLAVSDRRFCNALKDYLKPLEENFRLLLATTSWPASSALSSSCKVPHKKFSLLPFVLLRPDIGNFTNCDLNAKASHDIIRTTNLYLEDKAVVFNTYGDQTLPSLMLIHGMANTAQSCYGRIVPYLDKYYVILCEVDGHTDKETGLFISIEDSCEKIEQYVAQNLDGTLCGLSGFSMGATLAVELMARNHIEIKKVLLDAAFCVKMGALTPIYTKVFCWALNKIKSGKTIPAIMIESVMGKGNCGIVDTFYKNVEMQSIKNACRDVYRYEIPGKLSTFRGEVVFWYGSNEPYPRKTAKLLKRYLPEMQVEVFEGMGHGQFLNEHPEEYAQKINEFMN